jgi:prefoldin subunit 5
VDLGAQVYCQARVPDASRIFIDIGLGFRLECDVVSGEAARAARLRRQAVQAQVGE